MNQKTIPAYKKQPMTKRARVKMIFLYAVFILYILLLIKMLFLSRVQLTELFDSQRVITRSINLIPLRSISLYLSARAANIRGIAFGNIAGNVAVFIPLGVFLPLLRKNKKLPQNLLIVFLSSVFAEVVQGIFGIGVSDVDDVILNCAGGLIGFLIYKFLGLLLKDEKSVSTAVTVVSAVFGLPVILFLLFAVKMRF